MSAAQGNSEQTTEDLSIHYTYTSASTAASRRIIEETLRPNYSAPTQSFTSAQPSPTPSSLNLPLQGNTSVKPSSRPAMQGSVSTGNYRQACGEAEQAENGKGAENGHAVGFRPKAPARQQSWSEQDMRRKMQEGLFMSVGGKSPGFSEEK